MPHSRRSLNFSSFGFTTQQAQAYLRKSAVWLILGLSWLAVIGVGISVVVR